MRSEGSTQLTQAQAEFWGAARTFATEVVLPRADDVDRTQTTPAELLDAVRGSGYLGSAVPSRWGGGDVDWVSYGLLTEEIGRACSSLRSLLTVTNMCAQALLRFGDADQRTRWLPKICTGEVIIGFALTESGAGTATKSIACQVEERANAYVLSGNKKWISYGQVCDLYLVFAQREGKSVALVVDRWSEGVSMTPIDDVLGTRGSMLADVWFDNVVVPRSNRIGPEGMGVGLVANTALDHGRFSVAWGSTGVIRASLDSAVSYTEQRRQGSNRLLDFQLVRRQIANMLVSHTAARALCMRCAELRNAGDPRAIMETSLAKYFAAQGAIEAAGTALHLHGANGLSKGYPTGRLLRDATVLGVVEGTAEVHQDLLASYACQRPYLEV